MPGSRRYAWRIVGFSQSRDTKADLKVEMMPRKKTGLSEVARTTTPEEGHKGSKEELKRASQEREEQGLSITGLTRKRISIAKHHWSLLLSQGEKLCSPTTSSFASPLRSLCVSSLGKGFPEFLKEQRHPFTSSGLKSELDLYSTYVKQGTVYSYFIFLSLLV